MLRHTKQTEQSNNEQEESEAENGLTGGGTSANFATFNTEPGEIRDFKAFMPLLSALHLDKYDRNDFTGFNMGKSLRELRMTWKTLDVDRITYLMKFAIVHEVMKVEERKAIRRLTQDAIKER